MENQRLKKLVIEVVDNQIKDNNPPSTKEAYEKLQEFGFTKTEAKERIASVVAEEIWYVMHENQPFNEKRFNEKLMNLIESRGDII